MAQVVASCVLVIWVLWELHLSCMEPLPLSPDPTEPNNQHTAGDDMSNKTTIAHATETAMYCNQKA